MSDQCMKRAQTRHKGPPPPFLPLAGEATTVLAALELCSGVEVES